eukprot:EC819986.1.p1 GENE.EC819986.1~~EC819986.1.p1  ORF type:complete len:54 (+),score=21.99 EC819986.1:31-192(+)
MEELKKPELHTQVVNKIKFEIPKHYKITNVIGQGAYGIVCAATNTLTNEKVAN